ncbi:hypothetical protein SAMN05216228_1002298 [Rhizobium tibeticum]|uniref:GtrA-like protein n=1 Tax=Rhizobium tibeticum TaxID=501024 RepID=A0A1H8E642_9HYPH|nr:hypothetical protein [Rhizobium tibeticum]SEH55400.1 hypothetical protein RTCCBAU85039_1119 [Rhizobium tibeticum]SEN14258.1 hypothetical protein SAMN05216228_1002298 [Rhizobium tibeticum]
MAERARCALFWRFLALSIVGAAADVLLYLLLHAALSPFIARALSLLAALIVMRTLLRWSNVTTGGRLAVSDAGVASILTIAVLLNYGLFASLIAISPSLQPLAAMTFASVTSLGFGCFGYLRFVLRGE